MEHPTLSLVWSFNKQYNLLFLCTIWRKRINILFKLSNRQYYRNNSYIFDKTNPSYGAFIFSSKSCVGSKMEKKILYLIAAQESFESSKDMILNQWMSYSSPKKILKLHNIDVDYFLVNFRIGFFKIPNNNIFTTNVIK